MAEQLRTRITTQDVEMTKFLISYGQMNVSVCLDLPLGPNCTVHEKLVDGQWLLHSTKGPAIINAGYLNYYIDGYSISEKEWSIKATKLGKLLYT
jgi:hypothetical protein